MQNQFTYVIVPLFPIAPSVFSNVYLIDIGRYENNTNYE